MLTYDGVTKAFNATAFSATEVANLVIEVYV